MAIQGAKEDPGPTESVREIIKRFPILADSHFDTDGSSSRLLRLPLAKARKEMAWLRRSPLPAHQQELAETGESLRRWLLALQLKVKEAITNGPVPGGKEKPVDECPLCGQPVGEADRLLMQHLARKFEIMESISIPLVEAVDAYRRQRNPKRREAIRARLFQGISSLFPPARGQKFFAPGNLLGYYKELHRCLTEIQQEYRRGRTDRTAGRGAARSRVALRRAYPFFSTAEWDRIEVELRGLYPEPAALAHKILGDRNGVSPTTIRKALQKLRKKQD